MLRWMVRESLIRLYDILSIIIFSAAVNVLTGGLMTLSTKSMFYYSCLIFSFGSLVYSGWCFYWLYENTKFYLQEAAGVEATGVEMIIKRGKSQKFKIHFLLGIFCFFIGIIFFLIGNKLCTFQQLI